MSSLKRSGINWLIIGAMTGRHAKAHPCRREWVEEIEREADLAEIPIWEKDSLLSVMTKERCAYCGAPATRQGFTNTDLWDSGGDSMVFVCRWHELGHRDWTEWKPLRKEWPNVVSQNTS